MYLNFKKAVAAFTAALFSFVNCSMVQFATQSAALRIGYLSVATLSLHESVFAQATPEQAATLGNQIGREQRVNGIPGQADPVAGTITLRANNNATIRGGTVNGTTFSVNDLFPGASDAGNKNLLSTGSGTYGNMNAMGVASSSQTTTLMDPGNTTGWANAYRTLRNAPVTNPRIKDDLRGDLAVSNTQAIAAGTDANNFLGGMSNACTTTTTSTPGTTVFHYEDFRTCDRSTTPNSCQLNRLISGGESTRTVFHVQVTVESTETLLAEVDVVSPTGQAANAGGDAAYLIYYFGTFGIGSNFSSMTNGIYATASPHSQPPVQCTYSIRDNSPGLVVGISQLPAAGNSYRLKIYAQNTSYGGGYNGVGWPFLADLDVVETCSTVQQEAVEEIPEGCNQSSVCTATPGAWVPSGSMQDQVSTSTWECIDARTNLNIDGVAAGPNASLNLPELFPGEPKGYDFPVCYKARARNYVCSGAPDIPTDNCTSLSTNPQCSLVSTSCLPENKDEATGQCLFVTDTYDCGTDEIQDTSTNVTTTSCVGPIRCMGTTCVEEDPPEKNEDFANAVGQLSIANWAQTDADCVANGDCELFKGDGYTCKVVFWGVQDCCDQPTGVNVGDYLSLTLGTLKAAKKAGGLELLDAAGLNASGSWDSLTNFASTTVDTISQPIVSAWDSVVSRTASGQLSTASSGSVTLSGMTQAIQENIASWVQDTFGSQVADLMFGAGFSGGAAADFAASTIGQAAGMIMAVYAYYQLFVLAVQIIWACDDKEIELAYKKDTKSCHYLGRYCSSKFLGICYQRKDSYCCYKSPLARIIQEQVHKVTGKNWPSAQANPSCKGIKASDFATIDWSRVDLSEWIALLKSSKLIPSGPAVADSMYTADKITRFKSPYDAGASGPENTSAAISPSDGTNINAYLRALLWAGLP